jgi:hypothetical protein
MGDPVSDLLRDILAGTGISDTVYADEAELDATIPGWRFSQRGAEHVRGQLSSWYADPGQFQELERTVLPDRELVTFTLTWMEDGVEHTTHQAHVLQVREGRVVRHQAWCGGRWPAPLVAEMAGA